MQNAPGQFAGDVQQLRLLSSRTMCHCSPRQSCFFFASNLVALLTSTFVNQLASLQTECEDPAQSYACEQQSWVQAVAQVRRLRNRQATSAATQDEMQPNPCFRFHVYTTILSKRRTMRTLESSPRALTSMQKPPPMRRSAFRVESRETIIWQIAL